MTCDTFRGLHPVSNKRHVNTQQISLQDHQEMPRRALLALQQLLAHSLALSMSQNYSIHKSTAVRFTRLEYTRTCGCLLCSAVFTSRRYRHGRSVAHAAVLSVGAAVALVVLPEPQLKALWAGGQRVEQHRRGVPPADGVAVPLEVGGKALGILRLDQRHALPVQPLHRGVDGALRSSRAQWARQDGFLERLLRHMVETLPQTIRLLPFALPEGPAAARCTAPQAALPASPPPPARLSTCAAHPLWLIVGVPKAAAPVAKVAGDDEQVGGVG